MPHQRGDHPLAFGARPGPGLIRDSHESPAHPMHHLDFQRRHLGPRMVHHPSPGGGQGVMQARHLHASMYAPHPHSPAWYGNMAGSPHRVPGPGLSVASSAESLHEGPAPRKEKAQDMVTSVTSKDKSAELREKEKIIDEAIKRHMDDDYSIGTNEADAASALLFATTALRQAESSKVSVTGSKGEGHDTKKETEAEDIDEKDKEHIEDEKETKGGDNDNEEVNESNGPLKKRRKLLDFLREKPAMTAEKQPLHVSPLPSPQVRNRVAGQNSSSDTTASTSPPRTAGSSSTCLASLHETAKISHAAEISPPPSQVVIEHFPTVLHDVLTNSDFAGNVVQWLPGGEAWKILRWDALRRKVLPQHFSKLQDEDGKVAGSIDAFLWNLAAWGFEEIQSGPDVGAYKHKFFRKDSSQLCRQMTFSPKQNDLESPMAPKVTPNAMSEKLREASQPHSILQVPSLASTSGDGSKDAEKALKWREEHMKNGTMHSPTIAYPGVPGHPVRHPEAPIFVNYRFGDLAYSDSWHYFPDSPLAMRQMGPALTGYEHSLHQQHHFEFGGPRPSFPIRSPPRTQPGRSALRFPAASKAGPGALSRSIRRSSFPVSNRGKGNRGSPASRLPVQSGDSAQAVGSSTKSATELKSDAEEACEGLQKLSEEVGERVAVAISKKTKRKLPLSSTASAVEGSDEGEKTTKPVGV